MASTIPSSHRSAVAEMGGDAALDHRVVGEPRVHGRVVAREVQAPALMAAGRALDDELGHRGDVPELEEVAGHEVLPVVLGDLLLEEGDAPGRATEARV